ncbi:2-isopropylmalate synthase [Nonomuraea jiangxiensis]|uniref:2-isopropylmalate synthase n=1 Tax=Nonomuraea jiangxiensis TaxID=633440 RepID=UPI000B876CD3|nr:2-isopropylmalate synthase [Nonomuraea jiangxiensis]
MKSFRYNAPDPLPRPDRAWPDATITTAPRWLSTDLRDGNQALARPMSPARKQAMFDLLVSMGFKEIEVGFPVASKSDHAFVRTLIERELIPDDVRITVLVQARDELIMKTAESLEGAPRAAIHLYSATSPFFRRMVYGMNRDECKDLAVHGTRLVLKYAERLLGDCDLAFQYSPEHFADTEPDFSLEVCEAVMDAWQPDEQHEIILNFPTTVERTMPNVFADRIEWLHRNLSRREHVCLSVHPHNDRGTGVATAELAMLAGAQRIEGCLFGNGERAGNVDLVTLGLNLFTHGVDPGLDFSDLGRIRRTVEQCTGLPVHPRHPYGGSLVYTSFSGSHQDAIKKASDAMAAEAEAAETGVDRLPWQVPYLPLDPRDVGRTYETLVRITSQSGKGGLAYVLGQWQGLQPPRDLLVEFAGLVQARADAEGGEISPGQVLGMFQREYVRALEAPTFPEPADGPVLTVLYVDGGGIDAVPDRVDAVERVRHLLTERGFDLRAVHHTDRSSRKSRMDMAVYAECQAGGRAFWGVGLECDIETAALSAVCSALVRAGAHLAATGGGSWNSSNEPKH